MILRWFFSEALREAIALRKHVQRLLNAQRDLLTPVALQLVRGALLELQSAINVRVKKKDLRKQMEKLEQVAGKWLRPYPHAAWRENVEVLLVALAVAMGIRTFFLQPFKIPTGSMQPTLYGVTSTPDFTPIYLQLRQGSVDKSKIQAEMAEQLNSVKIPNGWQRVKDWIHGISYVHVVAQNDGELQAVNPPVRFLIFNIKQTLVIGGVEQTIWFPPDYGEQTLVARAALSPRNDAFPGRFYHKGEDVVKLEVHAGDHLFVDRLTYNLRRPKRGEIIVFETAGISEEMRDRYRIPGDEFYIKRLVGLSGEHVQIGNDRHLVIDNRRLDASTAHFENVYGFDPKTPPHESEYSGHVNGTVSQKYYLGLGVPPLFPDEETVYVVPTNYCLPMGDNTCNSSDSRFWGAIPGDYVIGKSFFVYWPLTKRFGVGHSITAQ
jgi:signal peptidase I